MRIVKPIYKLLFIFSMTGLFFLTGSFICKDVLNQSNNNTGVFSYMVNGKVYTMENVKAYMRNTTGGRKQLSLSNDRFVKFFFINPQAKHFDLSTQEAKEAIIRYNEPGTNYVYSPKNGFVSIKNLDDTTTVLSGEFELELVMPGNPKVIKISQGQIINVPIVNIR